MTGYVLSRRAREDLREIWNYTADRWDDDQADRYVRQLHRAVELIAMNPERGRSYEHVRRGYRMFPAGAHMIFFRQVQDRINIVRVLHQRMDFQRHL
ncbi:MAG: type II toxin-antitoxin system RelE/ParE family toxin [Xanthobacteraceae bacterium]|nr:type II toxin-antitoxin system RelE/ParE family toxin [Xanthobacteraceae bacterium]